MKIFICEICGHIAFNNIPDKCPVCGAEKDKFKQNDTVFKESREKSPEAEVKHIPEIIINKMCAVIPGGDCVDVIATIGKVIHPMEEKHYIRFIDGYQDDKFIGRFELTPLNLYPSTCFHLKKGIGKITIVENCNIHGYWKSDVTI
ncbi:MAG: desulfoferrodoxin family protein [Proteobacteria bacterium]|nr:desulfoferrodoxin family protein [Pseudomonadota bacterium]